MPYHGIQRCVCGINKYKFVKDCGRTGMVSCSGCGRAKRVKWSRYITPEEFKALKKENEQLVRQVRHKAIRDGAFVLTAKQYNALKLGDVIIFNRQGGQEKHNAVMLAGIHVFEN